jgi:hypothetical protein
MNPEKEWESKKYEARSDLMMKKSQKLRWQWGVQRLRLTAKDRIQHTLVSHVCDHVFSIPR